MFTTNNNINTKLDYFVGIPKDVCNALIESFHYEHNNTGEHIFTDITTGQKYKLAVDNGNIVLIPVT